MIRDFALKKIDFNPQDCVNHLEHYKLDIQFVIITGNNIVEKFKDNVIDDRELVAYLRGYMSLSVMTICKLKELIDFIIKSNEIKFNDTTCKLIEEIQLEYQKVKMFRNQYIAHPIKIDHQKKVCSLLPIVEIRKNLNILLEIDSPKTSNEELLNILNSRTMKLEKHQIIIDYIINAFPKPWLIVNNTLA